MVNGFDGDNHITVLMVDRRYIDINTKVCFSCNSHSCTWCYDI